MGRKSVLCLYIVLFFSRYALGQSAKVSGYIADADSKEPLIGAIVSNGREGASANSFGYYVLSLPAGRPVSVTCSQLGYRNAEVSFTPVRDTVIHFLLTPDAQIDAAIVSGKAESGIHSTLTGAIDLPMTFVRNAPALLGEPDILKAAQLLPGIEGSLDGTTGLLIRGGSADENLFLLDGIPLYNVSHMMGLFSAFSPDAVKKVTLYKGSFPARFGGRVSGVVDIWTNEGNRERLHGSIGVGLLNDKLHLEFPLFNGRTTVSLSGRVLHTFFLNPILRWTGSSLRYFFYDFNGKITYYVSTNDRFYLTAYSGLDDFYYAMDPVKQVVDIDSEAFRKDQLQQDQNTMLRWGNRAASFRWNHLFSPSVFSSVSISYNHFHNQSLYENQESYKVQEIRYRRTMDAQSGIKDYMASLQLDWMPNSITAVKGGLQAVFHDFSPETTFCLYSQDELVYEKVERQSLPVGESSLWMETDLTPLPHLDLNAGLRAVLLLANTHPYVSLEPRISLKYQLGERWSLKLSYARTSQYVHLLSNSDLSSPMDMWVPVTEQLKPVISDQACAGAYFATSSGWEVSAETYFKWSQNVLEYRDGVTFLGVDKNWLSLVEMGIGRAYGLEGMVEKKKGKTTGWASCSLSRSERRFPSGTVNAGNWFPSKYNRIISTAVYVNHAFSQRIQAGFTWTLTGGARFTDMERKYLAVYLTPEKDRVSTGGFISCRNNYQLPPSHSLNLFLQLHVPHKRSGESVWQFSINNVYNAMNANMLVTLPDTYTQEDQLKFRKITYLPILPSVGYTYRF